MFVRALAQLLALPSPLSNRLGLWNFGDGKMRPGVFTVEPAPLAAPNPVVIITQDGGPAEGSASSRGYAGADVSITVKIWFDRSMSEKFGRETAWLLRTQINRVRLTVAGWQCLPMQVTLPARHVDHEGFPGYSLQVTVLATQTTTIGAG